MVVSRSFPSGHSFHEQGITGIGRVLFSPQASICYHPGHGLLLSASDDPNLAWHSLDGDVIRVLRLDFRREPVTDTDQANHHAWWQARIRREEEERVRQFYREYEKHETFPKIKSLWDWITVDDAGFIWMQDHFDYSGSADVPGATTYRVLSPEGEYLGMVEWPTQRGFIQNGYFLSRIEDAETGKVVFTVYRMVSKKSGFEYP